MTVSEIWGTQEELLMSQPWRPWGGHSPERDDMKRTAPPVPTALGVAAGQSSWLGTRAHLLVLLQPVGTRPHTTFQGQVGMFSLNIKLVLKKKWCLINKAPSLPPCACWSHEGTIAPQFLLPVSPSKAPLTSLVSPRSMSRAP